MASIHLQNVTKTYYKTKTAVQNINMEIADRSFTILLGPSEIVDEIKKSLLDPSITPEATIKAAAKQVQDVLDSNP